MWCNTYSLKYCVLPPTLSQNCATTHRCRGGYDVGRSFPIPIGPQDELKARSFSNITPLALTTSCLCRKSIRGKDATKEELHTLETIRRLLLRVEVVHTVSWLWPRRISAVADPAEGSTRAKAAPMTSAAPMRMVWPILRRTERGLRSLPPCLGRWVGGWVVACGMLSVDSCCT